jgi:hypothetical protein
VSLVPPSVAQDARNRAWRTFGQGLLFDVLLSVCVVLTTALAAPDFAWTGAHWTVLGLSLAKTAVMTATAYVARRIAPPNP